MRFTNIALLACCLCVCSTAMAQDEQTENKGFWLGDKTWTWYPTDINAGAVWGNAGYNAGPQVNPDNINGAWWGCGPVDTDCANTFADQLGQAPQLKEVPLDAYSGSTMTFKTDGTLCKYSPDGELIDTGTWKVTNWYEGVMDSNYSYATLNTSEGAIMWPYAINQNGYMPTSFEVVYLTDEHMILEYAAPGSGSWGEATWWSFASTDGVKINPDFKEEYISGIYNGIYYEQTSASSCKVIPVPAGEAPYRGEIYIPSVVSTEGDAPDLYVTEIAPGAFAECAEITYLYLPYLIQKIGARAFANCTGLKSIIIPESVREIEDEAFAGCSGLEVVRLINPYPMITLGANVFEGVDLAACQLGIPEGSEDIYSKDHAWDIFADVISIPAVIMLTYGTKSIPVCGATRYSYSSTPSLLPIDVTIDGTAVEEVVSCREQWLSAVTPGESTLTVKCGSSELSEVFTVYNPADVVASWIADGYEMDAEIYPSDFDSNGMMVYSFWLKLPGLHYGDEHLLFTFDAKMDDPSAEWDGQTTTPLQMPLVDDFWMFYRNNFFLVDDVERSYSFVYPGDGAEVENASIYMNTFYNCWMSHFKVTKYTKPDGIHDIMATPGHAKYYDLQGIEVANPTPGKIYIRVADGRSSKVIIR